MMQHKSKRARFRILAIGALVGSVLSAGVATSDVSAGSKQDQEIVVTVELPPIGTSSLRSGIRW
jgi:hypothetical protein